MTMIEQSGQTRNLNRNIKNLLTIFEKCDTIYLITFNGTEGRKALEQNDNIKQEIKAKIKSNAKELMVFSRYQLSKAVNDELFDDLDEHVQAQMLAVVLCDYITDFDAPFTHDYIDRVMGDDDPGLATGLYIYCNWRVFATYNSDEELAKKYQAVCDYIDNKIFDQWKGEKLDYFVKQTD